MNLIIPFETLIYLFIYQFIVKSKWGFKWVLIVFILGGNLAGIAYKIFLLLQLKSSFQEWYLGTNLKWWRYFYHIIIYKRKKRSGVGSKLLFVTMKAHYNNWIFSFTNSVQTFFILMQQSVCGRNDEYQQHKYLRDNF